MAGVKGRSGPPGHLHNSKYPWRSFWRRLALKSKDRWVASEVVKYAASLLSDKPDPSAGERHAIELASEAKAARLLIWTAIGESGFTHRGRDGLALMPAAEALPKFIGAELGALKLLGLERRARAVPSLAEYLKGKAEARIEPDRPEADDQ